MGSDKPQVGRTMAEDIRYLMLTVRGLRKELDQAVRIMSARKQTNKQIEVHLARVESRIAVVENTVAETRRALFILLNERDKDITT